jgi:hypothetical protein
MRIAGVALLLWLLASCAARPPSPDAGTPSARRQTDMYCMDDCVGNGGTREFCRQRCTD